MKVDLSELFDNPGRAQDFSGEVDLADVKRHGDRLFEGPVRIAGRAQNRAGIVSVGYQADFVLGAVCDRCLTPLSRPQHLEFTHTAVLSLNREDNDEYIVVSDGQIGVIPVCKVYATLRIQAL